MGESTQYAVAQDVADNAVGICSDIQIPPRPCVGLRDGHYLICDNL